MPLVRQYSCTHNNGVYGVAFSPDGTRLASASLDNQVKLWDAATGALLQTLKGHGDGVASVGWLEDGRLISASLDKTVRVWQADGTLKQVLPGHAEYLTCAAVARKGPRLGRIRQAGPAVECRQ